MTKIYLKGMQKQWLIGFVPPIFVVIFIPLIAYIFPEFRDSFGAMADMLKNPFYQVYLGKLGLLDLTTWQGFYFMYMFIWIEMVMIFVTVFVPVRLLTSEVDKKTLDVILSYPIPRWRFLLEKFSVYLTYNFLYPIILLPVTYFTSTIMFEGEEIDYVLVFTAYMGTWFLFFALGAISLLVATIFLETNKSLAIAGLLVIVQIVLERFGGLVKSVNILQNLSLTHYLDVGVLVTTGSIPIVEWFIVGGVGLIALISALVIFQKRELAI